MIGFITDQYTAIQVNEAVANAQIERGLPVFWLPGQFTIFTGHYSGLTFVPCDDEIIHTPLRGNPPSTPADFPEFDQIITNLGGMDARVTISPSDIIPTE
jgi:hypothetical protein